MIQVYKEALKARATSLKARRVALWVCHNSVNVSGNVIMLVEMAMVMLAVSSPVFKIMLTECYS
jgi:hypothetical protein